MKKLYFVSIVFMICSCGNSDNKSATTNEDSVGLTNPTAIDTVKHPSGVDNSSAISTDTAAINVQNSIIKADSAKHH